METVADINNLYLAFLASKKNSSWKPEVQRFEMNWLTELSALHHELLDKTYVTTPGRSFTLHERGKIRKIVGGRMRDRVVRHSFCDNVLMPYAQKYLIYDNGASQKGKGIDFSRKRLLKHLRNYYHHNGNTGYILMMDFSKYYDNIQHEKIRQMFSGLNESHRWLLDNIIKTFEVDVSYMTDEEYSHCLEVKYNSLEARKCAEGKRFMKKSVDIGDQTSQVFGIYFPTRIDNYIKIVRSQKYYGRYMDDSYIISPNKEELHSILQGVIEIAKSLGIYINVKKTQIFRLDKGFRFLQNQYTLTDTGRVIIKINKKRLVAMRRKLKKLAKLGRLDDNMFKSWMGGYSGMMSRQQRINLNKLFLQLGGNHESIS